MTAKDLLTLLAIRHDRDIFVTEIGTPCKRRMDAYAIRRSWTRANTFGYEIKVTRSDFLQDDKWQVYLKYCNEFYFVVPPGICDPREVPEGTGLIVASKNGTRLYTKRRAPKRSSDLFLDEMFRAILINRFQVSVQRQNNIEYWREWLETKEENKQLGWRCSLKLRELYKKHVECVQRDNNVLRHQNTKLEKIQKMAKDLDINLDSWSPEKEFANKIGGIPRDAAVHFVDQAMAKLQTLRDKFRGE